MKWLCWLAVLPLLGIDGTVVNRTTGQPVAEVPVVLMRLGDGGMMPAGTVQSSAGGKFSFSQGVDGPLLLQAVYQGVTYSKMLRPGDKGEGVELEVFTASRQPGEAKVVQHMILIEPSDGQLAINETVIYRNPGKQTFSDPTAGTFRFYLPPAAKESLQLRVTGPGNMPLRKEVEPAGPANVYKVDFALRPGESRFDYQYTLPFTSPGKLEGRILHPINAQEGQTRLVTPSGVSLTGTGVEDLGTEPQTQAGVYALTKADYVLEITGTGSLRALEADQEAMPEPKAIPSRIQERQEWVVGLTLLALAFGFLNLYRKANSQA